MQNEYLVCLYRYESYHSLPVVIMAYISAYPMVQLARERVKFIA